MEEDSTRKVFTLTILLFLLVLSFFIIKPILFSIIYGIILAFIFTPINKFLNKKIKSKTISAGLICLFLIVMIVIPFWFLTPILIEQSFKLFLATQNLDLVTPMKKIFPSIFASDAFSNEVGNVIQSFITKTTQSITNGFSDLILNFPILLLQLFVAFFVLYYILKDSDELVEYIQSLSPFSKEIDKKIRDYTINITRSVIYGQIIVGIFQGVISGVGFFIFKVPNALLLTFIAIIASIIPILGPFIVWIPVVLYLIISENTSAALGVLIFGLIASTVDNFLRPLIVSRRTKLNSSIILIGMIGGFLLVGMLGFILGPLILAYLLIILEIYRNKKTPGIFLKPEENN